MTMFVRAGKFLPPGKGRLKAKHTTGTRHEALNALVRTPIAHKQTSA